MVTYRPPLTATETLLHALASQVGALLVVDNGSESSDLAALRKCAEAVGAEVLSLETNRGIAAAQNVGIRRARDLGMTSVLLSDQDSLPAPDMVDRLLDGLERARASGLRVAAVGPVTVDERNAGAPLVFSDHRWGPRRADVPATPGALVETTFLLASGCLVDLAAIDDVGPMNEDWFIDHIDLEWGLRARRRGYHLFAVVGAVLGHSLGDRTQHIPGRERDVHIHSPIRNYYMARNTLLLVRSRLMPRAWRIGYLAWIAKYAVFYGIAVRPRAFRARLMARGLADGVRGRTGPAPAPRRAVSAVG